MSSAVPSIAVPTSTPSSPPIAPARRGADPRHLQIAALSALLAYGLLVLEFPLTTLQVATILTSCMGFQWLATVLTKGVAFDPRSALISALSLALLLRVDHWSWLVLAAFIAIGSKYALRVRGRHFFNPTALAIAALVLGSDHAWVSPGQWGHLALAGLAMAGAGLAVLTRARRIDVALAFALVWGAILLARTVWLGDPLAIAVHQLSSGAWLLFSLFMLTDPRTTPERRAGRVLFATIVACVGAWLTFGAYRADGLILALAACAPLVPIINAWFDFNGGNRS